MSHNLKIDDPRNHGAEAIELLQRRIGHGAAARPDANRAGFYELEDGGRVFYIHLSPATGKVTLLAIWGQEEERKTAAHHAGAAAPSRVSPSPTPAIADVLSPSC